MAKTVLVTGASSGIGRATAEHFAARGWNVAATMRAPEKSTLPPGERLFTTRLDVTDEASIREAFAASVGRFGSIDVLVNNAGYGAVGPFEASTAAQVERQFSTNVFGLMNVVREALPMFREQRRGVIVNIASVGGRTTFPLYSLYNGTKWAVEGFTECLQYELAPLGIRVKIIEPGPIKTDFYDRSQDVISKPGLNAYDAMIAKVMPRMQKFGATAPPPAAVAKTIYRAATDGSSKLRYPVNGAQLLVMRKMLPDAPFFALVRKVFLG